MLSSGFYACFVLCLAAGELDLVDVQTVAPEVRLDIRYATRENFTKAKLYPVARCLLRREVAQKVRLAQRYLTTRGSNIFLLLKDCYRPESAQYRMWLAVKGTSRQGYVADPRTTHGSVHTYGAAIDATLCDASGVELDMGTPFDFLGPLAEPRREAQFLAAGDLSPAQLTNRRLLRTALVEFGTFRAIPNEWWHFDAWRGAALRARYSKLDVPLDQP